MITFRVPTSAPQSHRKPCSDMSLICTKNVTSHGPRNILKSFTNKQIGTWKTPAVWPSPAFPTLFPQPPHAPRTPAANCHFFLCCPRRLSGALGWGEFVNLRSLLLSHGHSCCQTLPPTLSPPALGVNCYKSVSQLL